MANPAIERRGGHGEMTITDRGQRLRFRTDEERDWAYWAGDVVLDSGSAVIVDLEHVETALQRNDIEHLGVRLNAGDDVRKLARHLDRIGLVELVFPTFRDGRNYSAARILRDQYHYRGEIRAVGDVLADQLLFMVRCGIDCLDLAPTVALADAEAALKRFQYVYQAASDARRPVWQERLTS